MPFFDFHLHPSLKPQMSLPPDIPSPWQRIHIGFRNPDLMIRIMQCQGINQVVDSQASLDQLIQGHVNLVAIALHPPESAMMNDNLILKIAIEEQTNFIHVDRVRSIGTGDIYFSMLNQELANLKSHLQDNGRRLKLIQSINEYDPNNLNTVHAVFTVEGPHAFFGQKTGNTETDIMREFWRNFEDFTSANKILSMNIAHLQDNEFCNHAYGIQIFKARPFYPGENGIKPMGYRLLERMEAKSIMLDIKHMSLLARTQLYEYRRTHATLPIVCTHAGLTGISMKERKKYFLGTSTSLGTMLVKNNKPFGHLAGTSFNVNSINLYNEDVYNIWESGGLVGLSMDQRILGLPADIMLSPDWVEEIYDEDAISADEKNFFKTSNTLPGRADFDSYLHAEDIRLEDRTNYPIYHARHFMNSIFHLFVIANNTGFNLGAAAMRICIGSDFDGLIDPIDCCQDSTKLQSFKDLLLANYDAWEEEFVRNGGISISNFISPRDLMDNIFYRNAVGFLEENYR
jgi:microsomal dipeptidase-like Zn-dependent dipeptidase